MNVKLKNIPVKYVNFKGSPFDRESGSLTLEIPAEKLDKATSRGWRVREGKDGEPLIDVKIALPDEKSPVFRIFQNESGEFSGFHTAMEVRAVLYLKGLQVTHADIIAREYNWEYMGKHGVSLYAKSADLYVAPFEQTFEEF